MCGVCVLFFCFLLVFFFFERERERERNSIPAEVGNMNCYFRKKKEKKNGDETCFD